MSSSRTWTPGFAAPLVLALWAPGQPAGAADPPPNYVAAFGATTAAYRPSGGPWDGHQEDFVLTAGLGRYVTPTLALEVDLGPTWVRGDYSAFSIVPGVVWAFSPHAYLAARFPIAVDPDTAVYAAPGVGLSHTFANGLTPILEVNGVTRLDENQGDLGLSVTLGVLYSF
jgi:hypothetical protein